MCACIMCACIMCVCIMCVSGCIVCMCGWSGTYVCMCNNEIITTAIEVKPCMQYITLKTTTLTVHTITRKISDQAMMLYVIIIMNQV